MFILGLILVFGLSWLLIRWLNRRDGASFHDWSASRNGSETRADNIGGRTYEIYGYQPGDSTNPWL